MEIALIAVLIILLGLTAWRERRNARWWRVDFAIDDRGMVVISQFYRLQLDAQREIFGNFVLPEEYFVVQPTMIKLEYLLPYWYQWRDISDGPNPYIGTPDL